MTIPLVQAWEAEKTDRRLALCLSAEEQTAQLRNHLMS